MTIVIQKPLQSSQVLFKDLKVGQVFMDKALDYCMKTDEINNCNSVILFDSNNSSGLMFRTGRDQEVTPVIFNVTVTPV